MRSTVYEVDEDVFQITTEHDDGTATVETVFGREAYEAHNKREMSDNGQRDKHTSGIVAYASERRVARASYRTSLLH